MSAPTHPPAPPPPSWHDELLLEACITLREALQRLEAVRAHSGRLAPAIAAEERRAASRLVATAIELLDRSEETTVGAAPR